MLETGVGAEQETDGFVSFSVAGSAAKGDFYCAECGYGVSVQVRLPVCPMCSGTSWEQSVRSPLLRAASHVL